MGNNGRALGHGTYYTFVCPRETPSKSPSISPTVVPTNSPSTAPTVLPTTNPTTRPTNSPTLSPTASPTLSPTNSPTKQPSTTPSVSPTKPPTEVPSSSPSTVPTEAPTSKPSESPTVFPSRRPTTSPTKSPTQSPTNSPTSNPTVAPTVTPTASPTETPTVSPTEFPTPSPTAAPTEKPTDSACVTAEDWSQDRADELCPTETHHAYGVGLCTKYDNPDYQRRLDFALANGLYSSCNHACIYDYDSYNTTNKHAFKWTGSCYNVQLGKWNCIDSETTSMEYAHNLASTLCEPTDACVERVEWSSAVAESHCPDGYSNGDKGYGTAKVCPKLVRLYSGFYERADVLYQASFNNSVANHMFWSCSAVCIYDIEHPGVVYQWKNEDCWEMQTDWACITTHSNEYEWALEYQREQLYPVSTPSPVASPCVERVQVWDAETADDICGVDDMGMTNKTSTARVCPGYEDYQYRLDHSLANRVYRSCDAWCVYDIYKRGYEAFIWKNNNQCYNPVTSGLCIGGNPSHREQMTAYIDDTLCASTTPEPTEAPTCYEQQEWSDELMDEYCSVEDSGFTYKHNSSVGRYPEACSGWEDRQDDLLKSLAMKLYDGCSSWCVYDFYSDAILAWKWKNSALCWDLKTSGSCHWNTANGVNETAWEEAKQTVRYTCTVSPTQSPTDCMPVYVWNQARSEELCPTAVTANKTYGVQACDGTYQTFLEASLAARMYSKCTSWCVYDYDMILLTVVSGKDGYGGWIWRDGLSCWKWVTDSQCFEASIDEYNEVLEYAANDCMTGLY